MTVAGNIWSSLAIEGETVETNDSFSGVWHKLIGIKKAKLLRKIDPHQLEVSFD